MRSGRTGRGAGFTLIELLVVISVIVVISLASLPTFLNMMKTRGLRDGSRLVQQAILQAQTQAVAKRRPFLVEFVDLTGTGQYTDVDQWKVQIVDSHEDKDGNGDPFDTGARGTPTNDDEVVGNAEMLFTPKLKFERGTPGVTIGGEYPASSKIYGAIRFNGDGSAQLYQTSEMAAVAVDVPSENFEPEFPTGVPAQNHDFKLTMGEDAVYFDIVPATGRTSTQNNFGQ